MKSLNNYDKEIITRDCEKEYDIGGILYNNYICVFGDMHRHVNYGKIK